MTAKRFFIDGAKGITLGISAAIPGVSAGTIAVEERCYDTLVGSITGLRKDFKHSFLTLLPFIIGAILGALAALYGIKKGYDYIPFSLAGLFAGLIIGSLPIVTDELSISEDRKENAKHIIICVVSFIIAAAIGILTVIAKEFWDFDLGTSFMNREWWVYIAVLFAGFIAAGACVVPGISGSMMLVIFGFYQPILNTFIGETSIFRYGDGFYKGTGAAMLILAIIGALVGLFLVSKWMKTLLEKHRSSTFFCVFGLILGSLVTIFVNKDIWVHYYPHVDADGNAIALIKWWDYLLGGILLVAGALVSYLLYRYGKKHAAEEAAGEPVPAEAPAEDEKK
jgi:putative membrane protein